MAPYADSRRVTGVMGMVRDRIPKRLPVIFWVSTTPRDWRLPSGVLGWGLVHNRWRRLGMLSHFDWVPVRWSDHKLWRLWCVVDGVRLFVDGAAEASLGRWDEVHAIAQPGGALVLRESLDIERHLGCVM